MDTILAYANYPDKTAVTGRLRLFDSPMSTLASTADGVDGNAYIRFGRQVGGSFDFSKGWKSAETAARGWFPNNPSRNLADVRLIVAT